MSNVFKRIVSAATALLVTAASGAVLSGNDSVIAQAKYGTGKNVVENLNRGISAINTGKGMLVSWRFLANDSPEFYTSRIKNCSKPRKSYFQTIC